MASTDSIRSRVPLGALVADALREDILEARLQDGDELESEAHLATRFDVSVRVIRDALRHLDSQGLIQTRQGKRATVSSLRPVGVANYFKFAVEQDAVSIDELLELRMLLEVPGARLAAERATPEQITRIKRLMLDLEQAGTSLDQRVPADMALHDAIAEMSGNRFIWGILQSLSSTMAEERRAGGELQQARGSQHRDSDESHSALVAAIEARDPEAAAAAAENIVRDAQIHFAESN